MDNILPVRFVGDLRQATAQAPAGGVHPGGRRRVHVAREEDRAPVDRWSSQPPRRTIAALKPFSDRSGSLLRPLVHLCLGSSSLVSSAGLLPTALHLPWPLVTHQPPAGGNSSSRRLTPSLPDTQSLAADRTPSQVAPAETPHRASALSALPMPSLRLCQTSSELPVDKARHAPDATEKKIRARGFWRETRADETNRAACFRERGRGSRSQCSAACNEARPWRRTSSAWG